MSANTELWISNQSLALASASNQNTESLENKFRKKKFSVVCGASVGGKDSIYINRARDAEGSADNSSEYLTRLHDRSMFFSQKNKNHAEIGDLKGKCILRSALPKGWLDPRWLLHKLSCRSALFSHYDRILWYSLFYDMYLYYDNIIYMYVQYIYNNFKQIL